MNFLKHILILMLCCLPTLAGHAQQHTSHVSVCSWNVGHFNAGKLGGYQGTDVKASLRTWRTYFRKHKVDILGLCEWAHFFDKGNTVHAAGQLLRPLYSDVYIDQPMKSDWIINGLCTDYRVKADTGIIDGRRMVDLKYPYYCTVETLLIDGHELTVIIGHIPWQTQDHRSGLEALKAELRRHKTFVFMGDTNATQEEQASFATEEGYNLANPVDGQWLNTYEGHKALDNIITSPNIRISHVSAAPSGLYQGDHYPLFARLQIDWER